MKIEELNSRINKSRVMKTEELNSRIKELNDYFISQIIEGNYQVIKKESTNITIKVSSYMFTFWFGNDVDYFECTEMRMDQPNFMKLQFDDKKTKKTVRNVLMSEITETREEEIERLEEKLQMLKSIKV